MFKRIQYRANTRTYIPWGKLIRIHFISIKATKFDVNENTSIFYILEREGKPFKDLSSICDQFKGIVILAQLLLQLLQLIQFMWRCCLHLRWYLFYFKSQVLGSNAQHSIAFSVDALWCWSMFLIFGSVCFSIR